MPCLILLKNGLYPFKLLKESDYKAQAGDYSHFSNYDASFSYFSESVFNYFVQIFSLYPIQELNLYLTILYQVVKYDIIY